MGTAGLIITVVAILAFVTVGWAAVTSKRSIAAALVALAVACMAAFLAYYALVESQSVPWALGYGTAAVVSAAVAGRHLVGRLLKSGC